MLTTVVFACFIVFFFCNSVLMSYVLMCICRILLKLYLLTYLNRLHLAPDSTLSFSFLQVGCCSWRPTSTVKALKPMYFHHTSEKLLTQKL